MNNMEDFSGIVNWENVFKESESFKNQKPFRFAFIREFFHREFYDKLYEGYPDISTFQDGSDLSRSQFSKIWGEFGQNDIVENVDDSNFNEYWNKFQRYTCTKEFIENFRKFSGTRVNKLQSFHFIGYTQGGFQLPHIHNAGPNTLVLMLYFSKGWKKGQAGGTYMASEEDESKIIFEPYNLDNSLALFQDSPKAAHGSRVISENVERRALQITLEEWSEKDGWSSQKKLSMKKRI